MNALIKTHGTLLACCLIAAFAGAQPPQDRNVAWVHGLGGGSTTWDVYDAYFDSERYINGISDPYPSDIGVDAAARNVVGDLVFRFGSTGSQASSNIGIGHSMGGVVTRQVDRSQTQASTPRFGGIITVGSPNDGAYIINALRNGEVATALNHGCTRLTAGPLSELPVMAVALSGLTPATLCNSLQTQLLDPLLGSLSTGPSLDHLEDGSGYLANLNNYASTIPRISIWGNEESPVHWRLLSSFATNNANDLEYVLAANAFRSFYTGMTYFNATKAVTGIVLGFFHPTIWASVPQNTWRATQWRLGARWIRDSEGMWKVLTGCSRTETYTHSWTLPHVDCTSFGYTGSQAWIDCIMNQCGGSLNGCGTTYTYTYTAFVQHPSDGLVCAYSQILDGLPQGNIYEAVAINHAEQVGYDNRPQVGNPNEPIQEMERVFNLIWETRGQSDFFTTPSR